MGWAGGSSLAEDMWLLVREYIPEPYRRDIARKVIDRFEDHDCDTMDEAEQLCKDAGRDDGSRDEYWPFDAL